MPQFDSATRTKITALRALRTAGTAIEGPYELVKVEWPDDTIYYGTTDVAAIASVAPPVDVELRLIPDDTTRSFIPVSIDASIGDEEVEMKFWDADDVISDLLNDHGEGIRTTLFYWFPQVELMLPVWEGHLRLEDEADATEMTLKAVQGFRSSEASMPSRGHYEFCQAIFGGILETQAEIDELGCPYNLHLGGTIGTLDPGTGEPWTFCPRRDTGDCTTRGVNPLRHLSHRTITRTVVNTQSSGARLLSTSQGNETNLTEPVRVVMGVRRLYDMKVMAFRKDYNNNTPEHGWYQAFYEACEGPVSSISQARIKVGDIEQAAVPLHYGARLGNFGDVSPDTTLSPHGFSATAFIRYAYGWVDPSTISPENASANALISGLRDIRVYGAAVAGQNGLLATYYTGNLDVEVGSRIESQINYPFSQSVPPLEGLPTSFWSVRWTGQIKPRYTETYTFFSTHDDGVKVTIDGDVVIDALLVLGTHSGNIALTADTLYDIEVIFTQATGPWFVDLKWQSASQALEIVPHDRLFIDADDDSLVVRQPTSNRVWQIARMLCDKRWGNGYDYEKLAVGSWVESAAWTAEFVRFTDSFGDDWDHQRAPSDVELIERKSQQQIDDMCLAGRLSRPYLFDGEIHISPLRALTEEELEECPEFTDEGDAPNIIQEEIEEGIWKSTLRWSRKSDLDLPNRIECTYDSATDDYKKTSLQPVEDIDAQLRAGRIIGDNSLKKNEKKYHLLGVTGEAHGMKLQWALLDLGPHDEGGLQNNLRLTLKIWFLDAIDLHMSKVIKVTNAKLQAKYGFTHFRIMKMERADNLHYELEVQAYNHDYMETFETELGAIVSPPESPSPEPPQSILTFGSPTYENGVLTIPIV